MTDQAIPAPQSGHGVRIVLGNAAVATVVSALVAVLAGRAEPKVDEAAIVQRAVVEAVRVSEARFVDRELVKEQLRSIAEKVESIDRRTADLPRMAAELSLVQRNLGR